MNKQEQRLLIEALGAGNAILVLGDISDAVAGRSSLHVLRQEALIELGFNPESNIRTADALTALRAQDPQKALRVTRAHLERGMRNTRGLVHLIQAPWDRIYSIGGVALDNIDFGELPNPVIQVSSENPMPAQDKVTYLVDDSTPTHSAAINFLGEHQTPQHEIWRNELKTRALRRPVVLVSRSGGPIVWSALSLRRSDTKTPCLVVIEQIEVEDQVAAINAGARLIQGSVDQLARAFPSGHMRLQAARRSLARKRKESVAGTGVQLVPALVRDASRPDGWEFLQGFDPTWYDVSNDRVISLPMVKAVLDAAETEEGRRNLVIVRARAGSGKTASLMQAAYRLAFEESLVVAWIDRSASQGMARLVDEVLEIEPDCVVVDDVDIFGDSAPELLRKLGRNGLTLVLASVRTARARRAGNIANVRYVEEMPMSDHDIDHLDALLERAGLLTSLQGMQPRSTRLEHIRKMCQRDLLAALVEIVSGKRFEERIRGEFEDLYPTEQRVYLTLAVFVSYVNEARVLSEEDLLRASLDGAEPAKVSTAIDSLLHAKLLIAGELGVGVRHRVIADALVAGMSRERVGDVVGSLLVYFASLACGIREASHPHRRTMIALLSHTLMVQLELPVETVRRIYASVQSLLKEDFHFWLQRGAFETEKGDLDLAAAYLKSARSCAGGVNDYKVTTEWGILRLLVARRNPGSTGAEGEAEEALRELIDVAKRHGSSSPHTFKVLAGEGDVFLKNARGLTSPVVDELRAELDNIVSIGLRVCRDNGVAMEALSSYGKRRNIASRPMPAPTFPMPKPSEVKGRMRR